jgi:hypothetical protein
VEKLFKNIWIDSWKREQNVGLEFQKRNLL